MPFALTDSHVELLFANNAEDSFPHSEFATLIQKILQ